MFYSCLDFTFSPKCPSVVLIESFCAVHVHKRRERRSGFKVVAFSTLLEHVVTCAYAWGVWHVAWNRIAMPFSFLSSLSQLSTIVEYIITSRLLLLLCVQICVNEWMACANRWERRSIDGDIFHRRTDHILASRLYFFFLVWWFDFQSEKQIKNHSQNFGC